MVERLGLAAFHRRLVGQTSLGDHQRTAIARVMVTGPALVVLDEPTSHQDDDHVDVVVAAIRQSALDGSAVLVATHDEQVLRLADRVVRLEDGRIVEREAGQGHGPTSRRKVAVYRVEVGDEDVE